MGEHDLLTLVPRMLAIVAVLLGLAFVVLGVRGAVVARRRHRSWTPVRGEVVGSVWNGVGDSATQHWVLRWTGADGVERTAHHPFGASGGSLRHYPFPVDLLVDPNDPSRARVATGLRSGGVASWLFLAVGAVFVVVGAAVAVAIWT